MYKDMGEALNLKSKELSLVASSALLWTVWPWTGFQFYYPQNGSQSLPPLPLWALMKKSKIMYGIVT